MPTIILLDSSLSMLRSATKQSEKPSENGSEEGFQLMDLAKWAIDHLLNHLEKVYKLEHVAVLAYANQCDLVVPFIRDIPEARAKVTTIDCFDSSNIIAGLKGLVNFVLEQWGNTAYINILVVTDGGQGHGNKSFKTYMETKSLLDREILLPFSFNGTMNFLMVNQIDEVIETVSLYEKLIDRCGLRGQVLIPNAESPQQSLTRNSVEKCVQTLIDTHYQPFIGRMTLGDELASQITLCPPPSKYRQVKEFNVVEANIEDNLDIKGFLTLADVASPPVVSRHLILPYSNLNTEDDSRTPSLCVLLHGALKVSSLCALVQVSKNWFGIIFSHADSKKKSCLMLALFEPGDEPVPWLGNLQRLGPLEEMNATSQEPFPVKLAGHKPSYSSNPVVWIKQNNLQSDVQKVLRHARKMPEKTAHFYKELNRIKKAALSTGFYELLDGVATVFERECALLPGTAHAECAMQLTHAASELRKRQAYDPDYMISASSTKLPKKE